MADLQAVLSLVNLLHCAIDRKEEKEEKGRNGKRRKKRGGNE